MSQGEKPVANVQTDKSGLVFETDRGAQRSFWIASAILVFIVLWMGSGFMGEDEPQSGVEKSETAPQLVAVSVRTSVAEPVTLSFQAEGQAEPDRDSQIRAEASGEVAQILAQPGQDVERGDPIARLSPVQAEADLRRALEDLESAQRELENAQSLRDRGVATEDRVVDARATLASNEAEVTSAQEALARTNIIAPFDGRIEALLIDEGEFVSTGAEIGRIVDITPLTVSLEVPQQSLSQIRVNQEAEVTFITGEVRKGEVTFVGTSASSETRTFLTEIEVENVDGTIPAGISAEVNIPTGEELAHFITPSVVSLNPTGIPGVKTVENNEVVFYEITVVQADVDGFWVTGLPDEIDLITIGQGFVREGEIVDPQPEVTRQSEGASQ